MYDGYRVSFFHCGRDDFSSQSIDRLGDFLGGVFSSFGIVPHIATENLDGQISGSSEIIRSAMAPIKIENQLVVLDLPGLLAAKSHLKRAVLHPLSVNKFLSTRESQSFELMEALQEALYNTERTVVFSPMHAAELSLFGARNLRLARFPALAPFDAISAECDVLLISQLGSASIADRCYEAIKNVDKQIEIRQVILTETGFYPSDLGRIHLHLAPCTIEAIGHRVIDSFAARRPVIQYSTGNTSVGSEVASIEHFKTGVIANSVEQAALFVSRLRADPAGVAIFQRNADRVLERYNKDVAEEIWNALL